jgi:hypothetical protein
MASVVEVYGHNYSNEAILGRIEYSAKALAQNIAQLQFNMRHESDKLWEGNNMVKEAVGMIKTQVTSLSPHLKMDHIDKTQTDQTKMLPYLIDGAVEYFRILDYKRKKIYLIYITPFNMETY